MEIVKLPERKEDVEKKKELLESIDALRECVDSGKITAFIAVGLDEDSCAYRWQGSVRQGRLELLGALEVLKNFYMKDEFTTKG